MSDTVNLNSNKVNTQQEFLTHPGVVAFVEHIEKAESPNQIRDLLGAARYLAVLVLKRKFSLSDRQIGPLLGVSNSVIGRVRAQFEGGSK